MTTYNFVLTLVYFILIILGTSSQLTLHRTVGESVTLGCSCQNKNIVMCYWYKQTPGHKPVEMSSYYKHNTKGDFSKIFKGNKRFSLDNSKHDNNLTIKDLQFSDAASYFCMSSNLYNLDFLEMITLNVEGAGFGFQTLVREVRKSELGSSVTMNCSLNDVICDGEHRVYWFKKTEDSGAGVIYSHGGSRDQCEKNTDSQSNSCVYNLPTHQEKRTDDWTQCAVASCGRVLFGNKRNDDSGDEHKSSILVYVLCGALASTIILIASLAFSIYKIIKTKPSPTVTTENEESLHYAALQHHQSSRPRKQKDSTTTECVYSGVRL